MNLRNNDVNEDIKTYPDHFFNTIFCDPPYNLSSEWFVDDDGSYKVDILTDFSDVWGGLDEKFLDSFFIEAFRVLKYGGFAIMFGMDRQLAPFIYYATKHGFEIQQSLYWFYTQNFPKPTDASKRFIKRNESDMAEIFNGYKYGVAPLKQVVEQILILRKPEDVSILEDMIKSFEDDRLSPSVLNIEGERVPVRDTQNYELNMRARERNAGETGELFSNEGVFKTGWKINKEVRPIPEGRFPAQMFVNSGAANIIDEQSGERKFSNKVGGYSYKGREYKVEGFVKDNKPQALSNYGDAGGASKVLHTCDYENGEIDLVHFCSKTTKKERNEFLKDGEENNHPTLKPLLLTKRISGLFTLPKECNQRWYVPFSGVGSEIIGILMNGIDIENIYGCEGNKDFFELQKRRIQYYVNKINGNVDEEVQQFFNF
jgi:DNA modification methylase